VDNVTFPDKESAALGFPWLRVVDGNPIDLPPRGASLTWTQARRASDLHPENRSDCSIAPPGGALGRETASAISQRGTQHPNLGDFVAIDTHATVEHDYGV
jgi:hypothetical protein